MSEIKNNVCVTIHDVVSDICERLQLLHKMAVDMKECIAMTRAREGEK